MSAPYIRVLLLHHSMVLVKHSMEQISETYDGIPMPSKEQEDTTEA
ncbi:hypothetical protein HanPI659440_Chr14g0560171 [Helianthus annuus]|nr:hypothetical protein HanPI659440_Chr14g0560171 [Helianthus annuus]